GRKLDAQRTYLLDEREILVGQRQNGDLSEIDLLLAGQREEEVERALKSLDVDDQRALVGGKLGRDLGGELHDLGRHCVTPPAPTAPSTIEENCARACERWSGTARRRAASAAVARRAASAASSGAAPATASISARTPLQWSAMSQPAAS